MNTKIKKIAIPLLIATAGAVLGAGIYKFAGQNSAQTFEEKQNQPVHYAGLRSNTHTADGATDFTIAAAMATPAVVHIKVTIAENPQANAQGNFDPFREFFGDRGFHDFFGNRGNRGPAIGSGSGVIISPDGYIATNNHVVKDADKIEVILNDKRSYKGKVIGTDPNTDLALIKINENDLPFVKYGNSDDVKVGEWVLAVGNPFNLTSTVTAGIVSAKGRNINIIGSDNEDPNAKIFPIESFIQTDAAVNPGNSGGALVSTAGELIGINTAIASQTGSYAGYSFAVPVNLVKKVMDDLLKYGEVQRAFLGITMQDVTSELAKEKDIKNVKGVYVKSVAEGGAADKAGIQEGDVITSIDNTTVNSMPELQEIVGRHRPGDQVGIVLVRAGKEKSLTAELRNKDLTTSIIKKETFDANEVLGADLANLMPKEKSSLRIPSGVKISRLKPSSKLSTLGVREGFIITKINNKPVNNESDVTEAVNDNDGFVTVEGIYPNTPNTTRVFSFGVKN